MTPERQNPLYIEVTRLCDETQAAAQLVLNTPWYRPILMQRRSRQMMRLRDAMMRARDAYLLDAARRIAELSVNV